MSTESSTSPIDCPHLLAGRAALERGAWEEARTQFRASLASSETPDAHEGLALASIGVSDAATAIAGHERAYALHRERGDRRAAARAALALMWDTRTLRGDTAVANGWLERARELLDGLEPAPEHGWLLVRETESRHLPAQDFSTAGRLLQEAREIAREHGDVSLEMEALAFEGGMLLRQGEILEGLRRLDQAAAASVAGEVGNYLSASSILCQVLSAYEKVRDFERASQWIETLQSFTSRLRSRPVGSLCRSHLASLLIVRGRWTEAEAALATGPMPVPWAGARSFVMLGELRLRQGRYDEAEALFRRVPHDRDSQLGLAALALDRGDALTAADLIERSLRQMAPTARLDRARALTLAVRVRIALGEREAAAECARALEELAEAAGTPGMQAASRYAIGELAIAHGDHGAARLLIEDALDGWSRAGMPFERAAARLSLAQVLETLGREGAALAEAARAGEEFAELGASTGVADAEELVRRLSPPGEAGATPERPLLSGRELEVLSLVAQGLSNKEVASRLFLSEHTIKRHLANILTRLGLPSRAAAVAYAVRNELL
jgi:ATP/maltotriose-dependent transcriptional regulator MalT